MNTTIIIAIIAVLICICSSISGGAAFYMNQETEVPKSSTPPPPPTGSPPPPAGSPPPAAASGRKYTKSVNMDSGGSDIACFQDGSSADFCKTKCDNDTTCKGYNYISVDPNRGWGWAGKSGCCYKTINGPLVSAPGIDFYALDSPSTPPSVVNAPAAPAGVTCTADGTWSNNSPVPPGTVITKSCSPGSIVRAKCKADGGWDSDNKCSPAFKPDNTTIKSRRRDNFCMDVPGSNKDNGTQMTMWDCHGGENQQFKMDDKQRLVNKNSGKCLDVSGGAGAGATVIQWDCHDGNNQKWEYDEKGRLHPVHAMDKCLDISGGSDANGSKLLIWDCHDGNNQQWFTGSANPGDAIKCTGYNPKGTDAVYRYLSDKKMSHYPSGEIAGSWDPNWWNNPKQIDCTGFTLGADMIKISPGDAISCIGNEGYIQRYVGDKTIRGYPSMEIADSWDSNWRSNKIIDCSGLISGPVMAKK